MELRKAISRGRRYNGASVHLPELLAMSDVTRILSQINDGDPSAAEQLLPLVYDELRKLAAAKMAHEKPGKTLQATALVHEAYVRLVDRPESTQWEGRSHFFVAAAEAMRRILVEASRRRRSLKRGGDWVRQELVSEPTSTSECDERIVAVDEALENLGKIDPQAAELVKLRFFAGFTGREAADILGVPPRTADRIWAFARSWLFHALRER